MAVRGTEGVFWGAGNVLFLDLGAGYLDVMNCDDSSRCTFLHVYYTSIKSFSWGFPGGTVVKNPPASAGDTGSSPGLGRCHMLWSD